MLLKKCIFDNNTAETDHTYNIYKYHFLQKKKIFLFFIIIFNLINTRKLLADVKYHKILLNRIFTFK